MNFKSFLSEIGWDHSFDIPLANEECRLLKEKLTKRRNEKTDIEAEIVYRKNKLDCVNCSIKELTKNLKQADAAVEVWNTHIETEEHIQRLVLQDEGRIRADIKQTEAVIQEVSKRAHSHSQSKEKLSKKIGCILNNLKMQEKSLNQWLENMVSQDSDALAIERYTAEDKMSWKTNNRKLEMLINNFNGIDREVTEINTECETLRKQVDKLSQVYRVRQSERLTLLCQWEHCLNVIETLDSDISAVLLQTNEVRDKFNKTLNDKEGTNELLANETQNLNETKMKVDDFVRKILRKRSTVSKCLEKVEEYTKTFNILNNAFRVANMDLSKKRAALSHWKNILDKRQKNAQSIEEQIPILLSKLNGIKETIDINNSANNDLKKIAQLEMIKQKEIHKQMHELEGVLLARKREVKSVSEKEKLTSVGVERWQVQLRSMKARLYKLNNQLTGQNKELVSREMMAQRLMIRIDRMSGRQDDQDRSLFESRISELGIELDKQRKIYDALFVQRERSVRIYSSVDQEVRQLTQLVGEGKSNSFELRLQYEIALKELQRIVKQRRFALVDSQLLEMKVQQLVHTLGCHSEKVLSKGKYHEHMEAALKTYMCDINCQRARLENERHRANEELRKSKIDVNESANKVNQIKTAFELMLSSEQNYHPRDEEESNVHIRMMIKAHQDRELWRIECEQLRSKLEKMETEVGALRNTCKMISESNGNTHLRLFSITKPKDNSYKKNDKLEEQLALTKSDFISIHKEKLNYEKINKQYENQMNNLNNQICKISAHIKTIKAQEQALMRDISLQQAKMSRSQNNLAQARKIASSLDRREKYDRIARRERRTVIRTVLHSTAAMGEVMTQQIQELLSRQLAPSQSLGDTNSSSQFSIEESDSVTTFGDSNDSEMASRPSLLMIKH